MDFSRAGRPQPLLGKSGRDAIKEKKLPTAQQMQAVTLSRLIYQNRVDLAERTRTATSDAKIFQYLIIGFGLFTTIFSSLNSAKLWADDSRPTHIIRVLAIAFPALTTAIAALNTFLKPAETMIASSRSIEVLGQLHDRIAEEIWTLSCEDKATIRRRWRGGTSAIRTLKQAQAQPKVRVRQGLRLVRPPLNLTLRPSNLITASAP